MSWFCFLFYIERYFTLSDSCERS